MRRSGSAFVPGVALAAALGLAACGTSAATTAYPDNGQPAPVEFSNAVVLGTATTANAGEVQEANLALERATDARVRDFAQHMIDDHTAATKLLLGSAETTADLANSQVKDLQQATQQSLDALAQLSGAAFDRAYMDHQVAMHRFVLNDLDTRLIPSTRDSELRSALQQVRETVANHLRMAEELDTALAAGR